MAGINKLSEAAVRQAKPKDKTYRLADGAGMYLEVTPKGARYWRLKYRYGGKEKRLALGVYPNVTLAKAREKTREAKEMLEEGKDPGEAKKQAKLQQRAAVANTFAAIGAEYVEKRKAEGAAPVTVEKLQWILDKKLVPPHWGHSSA